MSYNMKNISVAVVDDHKLFREGLCSLLNELPYVNEVVQACDGREFIQLLKSKSHIDLVFMDVSMPIMGGEMATKKALEINHRLKIIALTMHVSEKVYANMLKAGASGYVLKSASFIEIKKALHTVLEGKRYAYQGGRNVIQAEEDMTVNSVFKSFTERELQITRYIGKGFTSAQIAEELQISKKTVDKHRENIFIKSNVSNAIDLVIVAIKNGIIEV